MAFPRPSKPRALWADIKAFLHGDQRHKLLFAAMAAAMPALILLGFNKDARTNILPGKSVIYIQSWPADRSDAEIIAQQKIDQKKREAAQADRRAQYQRLADDLGIK